MTRAEAAVIRAARAYVRARGVYERAYDDALERPRHDSQHRTWDAQRRMARADDRLTIAVARLEEETK